MGCEQSLLNCNGICNKPSVSTGNSTDKSKYVDQFEFDGTNGLSTNREPNTKRSDISENLLISSKQIKDQVVSDKKNSFPVNNSHKFFLNLDKIKNTSTCNTQKIYSSKSNFESDRSNTSNNLAMNISEINDGVDTTPHRRVGKTFISLIKEFNFIQKLFVKCQSGVNINDNYKTLTKNDDLENKENESSPINREELSSCNNSISMSVKSFNTVNSIFSGSEHNKFRIKTTILKEGKRKTKYKDFFSKLKNLVYIPMISITGQVNNSFLIKKESDSKNRKLISLSISLPLIENISTYLFNFLENFNTNLNNCKITQNVNEECKKINNNAFTSMFTSLKLIKVEKIKLMVDLSFLMNDDDETDSIFNFGIGVTTNRDKQNPFILDTEIIELLDNLTTKDDCRIDEVIRMYTMQDSEIMLTGYQIIFSLTTKIEFKIKYQIYNLILLSVTDIDMVEIEMKNIDELIFKNYLNLRNLVLILKKNSDNKIEVSGLKLKREVKSTSNILSNSKEKVCNSEGDFTKSNFEVIYISVRERKSNQANIYYEYQL